MGLWQSPVRPLGQVVVALSHDEPCDHDGRQSDDEESDDPEQVYRVTFILAGSMVGSCHLFVLVPSQPTALTLSGFHAGLS